MLTLVLLAELQSGSRMKSGAPKNVGQTVFSRYSVALCAVVVEIFSSEYTAKWADSEISWKFEWSGSGPPAVQLPAVHDTAVVVQLLAHTVLVVPASQLPSPAPAEPLAPAVPVEPPAAPVFPPVELVLPAVPLTEPAAPLSTPALPEPEPAIPVEPLALTVPAVFVAPAAPGLPPTPAPLEPAGPS